MVEVREDGTVRRVKKGSFATRQSAPRVFDMNASIYVWWKDVLKKEKKRFPEEEPCLCYARGKVQGYR